MLESLLAGKVITTDNTVLLIDATPDQVSEDEVDKSIRLLGSMCHVVNLHDETAALQEFGAAARLPAH